MLRIIFVRHGDPDYGKDILTPLGHAQAEAVGKRLAKEKESVFSILKSTKNTNKPHLRVSFGQSVGQL